MPEPMTFNSFLDGWRRKNMKVLGLSAFPVGTKRALNTEDNSCGDEQCTPSLMRHAEMNSSALMPEKAERILGDSAGIHTGRTIEDLLEQVSRRVDARQRLEAKQEQRRKEIEKETNAGIAED